jgi:RNA polymerase sigma factor (TIGR02999 family)
MSADTITELLRRMADGDADAEGLLFAGVSDELRKHASVLLSREQSGHTLETTALVHEAWLRLWGGQGLRPNDYQHFIRVASRAMRHVLVDHARKRRALKRDADRTRVAIDAAEGRFERAECDLLALHEVLEHLQESQPELAQLIEFRFFGGLSMPETANVLGVSLPTAQRRWRIARMWLRNELDS